MAVSRTIDAVFEGGVFRPKKPIDLDDRTEVRLVIQPVGCSEAAIEVLETWSEGDAGDAREQAETWAYLKQALDEDRLSSRKLFGN